MATYLWPGDSGWPPAGPEAPPADVVAAEVTDPAGEIDLDALSLHADRHLYDRLTPLERDVLTARFGLDGAPVRSMKELHADLGLTRHQVRDALESALDKVRAHLGA